MRPLLFILAATLACLLASPVQADHCSAFGGCARSARVQRSVVVSRAHEDAFARRPVRGLLGRVFRGCR